MLNKPKRRGSYFVCTDQGAGLGAKRGITRWMTPCYHHNGKLKGKNLEPGVNFEVLRFIQVKRRRFVFIKVNDETEMISVGDIATG